MKHRQFGKLNWQVSALGFGTQRLPIERADCYSNKHCKAVKMIRYAIDLGINYIDTAYNYLQGKSEVLVGLALEDGYREKVKVATKMPIWLINSRQDMDRYLNEQLGRLRTSCVDFYLLHGLNQKSTRSWERVKQLGVTDWLEKKLDEGKIKNVGFSFHDDLNQFKNIIDEYNGWTFCQIQYNYMDAESQAGTKGVEYAASKGLGVVVVQPLAGGKLSENPPREIQALWEKVKVKRTPAEWALRWVWNHPQVSVVLSGMNTMTQVAENVASASRSGSCEMTEEELELISQVKQKYKKLGFNQCSGCGYCLPCPKGVSIPEILSLYNEYCLKEKAMQVKHQYWTKVPLRSRARRCIECGKCEDACPQKMAVTEKVKEAAIIFESRITLPQHFFYRGFNLLKTKLIGK